jgi:hypothetical protein
MTHQRRADPSEWELVASEAADGCATHSCILELRHTLQALCIARNDLVVCNTEQNQRIAALESTQHVHVDTSHLSDAEREQVAQDLASPAAWRPLNVETTYGDAKAAAEQILRSPVVVTGTFEHGGETYQFTSQATPRSEVATPEGQEKRPESFHFMLERAGIPPLRQAPGVKRLVERLASEGATSDHERAATNTASCPSVDRIPDFAAPATLNPVPVAERPWERQGWCDAEGRCFFSQSLRPDLHTWILAPAAWLAKFPRIYTHSLPHNALPVP